ncbi:hypothetical protein ZWY2020_052125 [Hordeum vulgare]|nr:hypothetical protein ZWY2020_052125 [Hordeum vulgare]
MYVLAHLCSRSSSTAAAALQARGNRMVVRLGAVDHEEFEEYAEKAKTLPDTTTNESKLCLYSLYKQATVGPVNTGVEINWY